MQATTRDVVLASAKWPRLVSAIVTTSEFHWDLPYEWTDEWAWEGLAFTLYFESPLSQVQREELLRLIVAWYDVGSWGGYGHVEDGKGVMHFVSEIVFKNDAPEPRVEWWADMGSAPRFALGALMLCLQNWSSETDVTLKKLVFGHYEGFTAE